MKKTSPAAPPKFLPVIVTVCPSPPLTGEKLKITGPIPTGSTSNKTLFDVRAPSVTKTPIPVPASIFGTETPEIVSGESTKIGVPSAFTELPSLPNLTLMLAELSVSRFSPESETDFPETPLVGSILQRPGPASALSKTNSVKLLL